MKKIISLALALGILNLNVVQAKITSTVSSVLTEETSLALKGNNISNKANPLKVKIKTTDNQIVNLNPVVSKDGKVMQM